MNNGPSNNGHTFLRKRNGSLSTSKPESRQLYQKIKASELVRFNKENKHRHMKKVDSANKGSVYDYCCIS
jgi:hypothetical protein